VLFPDHKAQSPHCSLSNDEQVHLVLTQLFCDRQKHVRVDRNTARVNDLETHGWEASAEHQFKITAEGVRGIGITHGSRFAKNSNAEGVPRLLVGDRVKLGCSLHPERKKWRDKGKVIAGSRAPTHGAGNRDGGGNANSQGAQGELDNPKNKDRYKDSSRDSWQPGAYAEELMGEVIGIFLLYCIDLRGVLIAHVMTAS